MAFQCFSLRRRGRARWISGGGARSEGPSPGNCLLSLLCCDLEALTFCPLDARDLDMTLLTQFRALRVLQAMTLSLRSCVHVRTCGVRHVCVTVLCDCGLMCSFCAHGSGATAAWLKERLHRPGGRGVEGLRDQGPRRR